MARTATVTEWRERTGRTIEEVARIAGISTRSAIRYLNGERPWPFAAIRRLKKASAHQLTDGSFDSSAASRAA